MGRLARQPGARAHLATIAVMMAACYPTFRFDGGAGAEGGAAAGVTSGVSGSASTGVRPTGTTASSSVVASGSSAAGVSSVTSTSGASSGAASSTTSGGPVGTPCDVAAMACTNGQACCFELSSNPTDLCVDTCETDQDGVIGVDHLSLACNADADCDGNLCCVYYTFLGNLKGTWCQSSCTVDEERACDPTQGGCAGSCEPLLYDAYGGQPPPPYDAYGICL